MSQLRNEHPPLARIDRRCCGSPALGPCPLQTTPSIPGSALKVEVVAEIDRMR